MTALRTAARSEHAKDRYTFRRSAARGLAVCQGLIGYILLVGFVRGIDIADLLARQEARSVAMYIAAVIVVITHAALVVQALLIRWSRAWQVLSFTVGATLAFDLGLGAATFTTGESVAAYAFYCAVFAPMSLIFLCLRPWRPV